MRGFVEAVAEHEVRGWTFDDAHPGRHLVVVAWLDGQPIGSSIASTSRPDLKQAGIGEGDHEFRIIFDHQITPADIDRLDVRAELDGREMVLEALPGSNQSRADQASDPSLPYSDPSQHPVFILGPARSGTSALALGLLRSGKYEGHGEGHLIPLATEMLRVVDNYYRDRRAFSTDTLLRSVTSETFKRAIRRSFVQLVRAAYPTGSWLDKTPTATMVRSVPLLLELWPNARFIFLKRRVIENILSRRRKFPQDTLENHYLDWVDVFEAWENVNKGLGDNFLEVEHLEMAKDNDGFTRKISMFLNLSHIQTEALRLALASDHPEQTSNRIDETASIESLELSEDKVQQLKIACDAVMSANGYSYTQSYYSTAP